MLALGGIPDILGQGDAGCLEQRADGALGRCAQGDFLAVVGGVVTHFQAAYIGDYDLHLCLDDLHRNRPLPLLAQPVNLRTTLMDDDKSHHQTRSFQFNGWEVMLAEPNEARDYVFRHLDLAEDES